MVSFTTDPSIGSGKYVGAIKVLSLNVPKPPKAVHSIELKLSAVGGVCESFMSK